MVLFKLNVSIRLNIDINNTPFEFDDNFDWNNISYINDNDVDVNNNIDNNNINLSDYSNVFD